MLRRASLLLALAGLLSSPLASLAQETASAPGSDPVDSLVLALLAEWQVPGTALAVVEDGRLMKARGYGLADVENHVPVTAETVFQSGSLGKQFTAAAVLLLAEDGALSLDDPLTRHFPEAPASWERVTVRHLLTHTSGLGAYEPRVDFRADYTEDELVEEVAMAPPAFEPGAEWSYSNSGYVVLGALVSRVTGAHWGEYLRDRVFRPAGMETARVISEADIVAHRASGYRMEDGELKNQEWVSPTFLSTGDGALYLTVLDLVRWDQALRDGTVLSEESRRAMWTPATLSDGARVGYGFGWEVTSDPAPPHVGHGGAWQGFTAYILRYEDPALTVAVLTNGAHANPGALAYQVAHTLRPELKLPRPATVPMSEADLAPLAGAYLLPEGDTVRVRVEDGGLTAEGMGRRLARWEPVGGDVFVNENGNRRLRFVRGADGGVGEAWTGAAGIPLLRLRPVG